MSTLALSIELAAKEIGVGRTTLYHLIGTGEIPARKAGKRTVILRSDLEAWLLGLPAADISPQPGRRRAATPGRTPETV